MKFIKPYKKIVPGDIYARDFSAGEDCPESILDDAVSDGAVEKPAPKKTSKK